MEPSEEKELTTYSFTPFTSRIANCGIKIRRGRLHYEGEPAKKDPAEQGLLLLPSTCDEGWGSVKSLNVKTEEAWPMPNRLDLRYFTMNDGRCFDIDTPLDAERAAKLWDEQAKEFPKFPFKDYVVGTGPFGNVAIWLHGSHRSELLHSFIAKEATELDEVEKEHFAWMRENGEYEIISREDMEDNIRQYDYRYVALEERWDEEIQQWVEYSDEDPYYDDLDLDSIEDKRCDGTFFYIKNPEVLQKYHKAGTPQRITVKWHAGREEFMAHFWLRESFYIILFKEFFSQLPNERADILLRLDTKAQKYEIAMRREGIPVDMPIPPSTYQLIVFNDGTEHYLSPNFSLEDGQWNWM